MRVMIINGSLGGASGNTAHVIERFRQVYATSGAVVTCEVVHLVDGSRVTRESLEKADAFLFTTGTYWDSWGSPLQKFLEDVTPLEGDPCWFGKPVGVLVTMHSVGGKGVLSRLQGVLNTFGLSIPPMSAVAYSLANQEALSAADIHGGDHVDDLWCVDDVEVLAKNLQLAAAAPKINWSQWPVDRSDPHRVWIKMRHEKTSR